MDFVLKNDGFQAALVLAALGTIVLYGSYSVQHVYIIMRYIFHVILGLNYVYKLNGVGILPLAWCLDPARDTTFNSK